VTASGPWLLPRTPTGASPYARPVRVSFFLDTLSRAGTETQLLALLAHLDRRRVEPTLVLLQGDQPASQALEPRDLPCLRLGLKALLSRETPRALGRLRQFWQQHPPDLLQCYFLDSSYLGIPWARCCGVPRVVRVRNNLGYWQTWRHRLLDRLLSLAVDRTLTNSQAGLRALQESGIPARRVVVLENGVDCERFTTVPTLHSFPAVARIGTVANLRTVKNLDGLLRACAQLYQTGIPFTLTIFGTGPEAHNLRVLQAELGLPESIVRWPGATDDVPAALAQMDLFVLPSHSEGMSNALLEAMAAGRVILATDVGANRDLLDAGAYGALVPPGDDAALAAGLATILRNPAPAIPRAHAARAAVIQRFSRAAMAERFMQFFESLTGGLIPPHEGFRPSANLTSQIY